VAVPPALVGRVDAHPPDDARRGAALVVVDGRRGLEAAHRDDGGVVPACLPVARIRRGFADEKVAPGRQVGVLDLPEVGVEVGVLLVEGPDVPERPLVEAPDRVGVAWLVSPDVQFGHDRVVVIGGYVDGVTGSVCRSRGWTDDDE